MNRSIQWIILFSIVSLWPLQSLARPYIKGESVFFYDTLKYGEQELRLLDFYQSLNLSSEDLHKNVQFQFQGWGVGGFLDNNELREGRGMVETAAVSWSSQVLHSRANVRAGKFYFNSGVATMESMYGAKGSLTMPYGLIVEGFGGVSDDTWYSENFDKNFMLYGAKAGYYLSRYGRINTSFMQENDGDTVTRQLAGVDAALFPIHNVTLSSNIYYDIADAKLYDLRILANYDLFYDHRFTFDYSQSSPNSLLRKNSLFTIFASDSFVQSLGGSYNYFYDDNFSVLFDGHSYTYLKNDSSLDIGGEFSWRFGPFNKYLYSAGLYQRIAGGNQTVADESYDNKNGYTEFREHFDWQINEVASCMIGSSNYIYSEAINGEKIGMDVYLNFNRRLLDEYLFLKATGIYSHTRDYKNELSAIVKIEAEY